MTKLKATSYMNVSGHLQADITLSGKWNPSSGDVHNLMRPPYPSAIDEP